VVIFIKQPSVKTINNQTQMNQHISKLALVVNDYDEAIDFYTNKLHFDLLEDTKLSEEKRWVVVRPPGGKGCSLLLAKAKNEEQLAAVGNQTGGRVFLFLFTDDVERDYKNLKENNITIVREITEEEYGKVTVFADLYGNLWDLIEPSSKNSLFQ
jgi:predicted enzyme related to lactoylglutathione lyase